MTLRLAWWPVLFLFFCVLAQSQTSSPFLNLRSLPSTYSDADLPRAAGPAARKVIWFGPTNELFWAASYAFQSRNPSTTLIPCWTGDPWKSGVTLLTRMIFEHQPVAVLGSIDSASTHLAEQIVAKAKLPLVSPVATDPSLTLAGVPWMFSCAPSDTAIAKAIVGDLREDQHPAAVFSGTDHESRMTTREILKEFSRRGRLPAFKFDFEPGSQVETQLRALAEAKPRSIILVASAEDAGRLLPKLRKAVPNTPISAGPAVARRACLTLAGASARGVRYPELVSAPHGHPFDLAFLATHGHSADYTAWLTFDAASLLATAISKWGDTGSPLHLALPSLSPFQGAAGEIRFDASGQNTREDLRMRVLPVGE